jgi:type IV pilus assembly protein PilM
MPALPVSDMRKMFRLNGKAYLQQDYADHVFDCCVLVPRADGAPSAEAGKPATAAAAPKLKVLVGGIKRETLEGLKAAAKHAGLTPRQITPGMAGPANAFEVAEPEAFAKENVALVDIGLKQTTITMLKKGELVMNRVVALGGERITAGLAESLSISPAEAEGIKIGMPAEVQQHFEPVISALGRELRASIDFYEHQQDVTVGQVLVSGGSSRSEFIVHTLQNEMMVPCKTWNPCAKLQFNLPTEQRLMFEQAAPHLAVALGAAVAAF